MEPPIIDRYKYENMVIRPDLYKDFELGFYGIAYSFRGNYLKGFAGVFLSGDRYKDARMGQHKLFLELKTHIDNSVLCAGDYRDLVIPENSLIYCDPPYAGVMQYGEKFDSNAFFAWCRQMSRDGHQVFVSEYAAPKDFECVWTKDRVASVGNTAISKKSAIVTEKLFRLDIKRI
jgi:DNA adenine methylase